MSKYYLYFIVFVTGGAVLALEILGTRVLGPFYGVTIFLWSALISITLIALSVGYYLGGKSADKNPSISRIYFFMILAGVWIILIPLIKRPVIELIEPLGLRYAVLAASLILFAPPLTFLGMVSPFAVKLKAKSLIEVGSAAGNIYAVSTIGSVLAALLTGFFLIPNIGVNKLTLLIGLVLLFSAFAGLLKERKKAFTLIGMLLLLILIIAVQQFVKADITEGSKGIIEIKQSQYGEIRVVDYDEQRFLLIGGTIHGVVNPDDYKSKFPYAAILDLVKYMFYSPAKMLLIGLGAGSVAKSYSSANWLVDAVEIDQAVTHAAFDHFGLIKSDAKIYHTDGRRYLINNKVKYDLIVLDAFGSSSIPFHLITKESFKLVSLSLKSSGIFAINIEAVGWHDVIVRSVAATLKENFKNVLALPIVEPPNLLGNLIILASNRKLDLVNELERNYADPDYRFSHNYYQVHAWDNQFVPNVDNVPLLTDDLSKSDIWSEKINLLARKKLHEYFPEGMDW